MFQQNILFRRQTKPNLNNQSEQNETTWVYTICSTTNTLQLTKRLVPKSKQAKKHPYITHAIQLHQVVGSFLLLLDDCCMVLLILT